jgi:hypothetical protein
MNMKKLSCAAALLAVAVFAGAAFAQSDVEDFPVGTTRMAYEIRTEHVSSPESLVLIVTGYPDGQYKVEMSAEAVGKPDELDVFGYLFGTTRMTTGGSSVAFDPLSALIERRDRLAPGEEYLLEGGSSFSGTELVTIATLPCIRGTYTTTKDEKLRMTIAFSLLRPVFTSPYVRVEELRDGVWVETLRMELVEYTVSEG